MQVLAYGSLMLSFSNSCTFHDLAPKRTSLTLPVCVWGGEEEGGGRPEGEEAVLLHRLLQKTVHVPVMIVNRGRGPCQLID